MNVINLAQGSLYMIGAFAAATAVAHGAPFAVALLFGAACGCAAGVLLEVTIIRRLYERDHLDQVLVTFGVILFVNELTAIVWGRSPLFMTTPAALNGSVNLLGVPYPVYRLFVIGLGLAVAGGLYLLIGYTRVGMLVRAGATHRELVEALGVNVGLLFSFVFALGGFLAGIAGAAVGPIFSVGVGMGEQVLITTFVVIVVGGLGSIRGAFIAALLVAAIDTFGRAYIPGVLGHLFSSTTAENLGAALSAVAIYVFMALVLIWRPRGLFPIATR
jgi:branched-chain amino acid transport system permease protein